MKKILRNILIGIMILSLLVNILLFMTVGFVSIEYEGERYLESLEWCESYNDLSDLTNDLLNNLEYYDNDYSEVERLEALDCFSNE